MSMGLLEIDINITDDHKLLRDSTRRFCMDVWRPAAVELDKLADPADVIAEGSVLWDVLRQSYKLGYHSRNARGEGMDALGNILIAEEMGYAAADLAISVGVSGFPFMFAAMSPDPAVADLPRQFGEDTEASMIGCWAITEPEHGSDWLLTGENSGNPACAPQVRAVRDGDDFIVNGQKAAWVSNGTIATHAALFLSLDPSSGMGGCGIAAIPLDLPGVTRGKPLNKLGQRALNQGEIFFDNVRIPRANVVCQDPAMYQMLSEQTLTAANAGMGITFVGLARAAVDEALRYAQERVQGGKVIFEHQSVKARLFEMFTQMEAARSLSRRVSLYNSQGAPALQYSIASKIFSTETAFRVASMAVQIFGGLGVSKESVIEKLFRDARAAMIEDGVNETLALGGAEKLRG
jgi:alkylation response protein AidB-like acyl-CoA dehydrogenase